MANAISPRKFLFSSQIYVVAGVQGLWSLITRRVEAGCLASAAIGRLGRCTSSPPQFGQAPSLLAQSAQNVHSNVQMRASSDSGGRSRSQHSQLGLSSSMVSAFGGSLLDGGRWTTHASDGTPRPTQLSVRAKARELRRACHAVSCSQ